MITVENLTKIYKIGSKRSCVALDGVNLCLPDKGMVFIVGKSGSGKSTLLNIMGGLDEATQGDVIVNGNRFSEMKRSNSFDGFRNSYTGIIFQDFHLIERLTVAQNIMLALDLRSDSDDGRLEATLKRVGLIGYNDRYPNELSGGQQQRVAIARALIKDPSLILADEPTGNLDSHTTAQIFDLLKEFSADRLVVVISHSMESAKKYGDRIIELGEGRIVSDVSRCSDDAPLVDGNVVNLPEGDISDEDMRRINSAIADGGAVIRRSTAFAPTVDEEVAEACSDAHADIRGAKGLSFKKAAGLGFKLINVGSLVVSVLVASFTVILFILCMMLYDFDSADVFSGRDVNTFGVAVMQKNNSELDVIGNSTINKLYRVTDEDVQAFEGTGYSGNIYKLYNMAIPSGLGQYSAIVKGEMKTTEMLYQNFYSEEALGVLVADEAYLSKVFGEVKVLAGDLHDKPYGVIITDYFADSMLMGRPELVVQGDVYAGIMANESLYNKSFYVNAIIDTGYKQRYAALMDAYNEAQKDNIFTVQERNAITGSEIFADFLEDAQSRLNIAYALDPDFIQAVKQNPRESRNYTRLFSADVTDESGGALMDEFSGAFSLFSYYSENETLKPGEAYISRYFYNQLFGTSLTSADMSEFVPRTITFCDYALTDLYKERPLSQKTFYLKGLWGEYGNLYISDEDFADLRDVDVFAYSLVFDSLDGISKVTDMASDLNYVANATVFSDLVLVARVMAVYSDLFLAVAIVLLLVGMLFLIGFGIKSVRSRSYEIGIMRALGAGQRSVAWIFLVQMLFAGALVCLIGLIGQFAFAALANKLITQGLATFMHNGIFKRLDLLHFDPLLTLLSLAAVVVITLVSALLPIIMLGRIKPMKILKAKD